MRLVPIAFALALLTGCTVQQNIADRSDVGGVDQGPAPQISGRVLAAAAGPATFDLAADRGHVVVVDFWGSWCGPCRAEQPDLNALAQHWGPHGVVFVGVAMRDDDASVSAYLDGQAVPYPTVVDDDGAVAAAYDVAAPPTLIVIDADGKVAARFLGTVAGVGDEIDTLLR